MKLTLTVAVHDSDAGSTLAIEGYYTLILWKEIGQKGELSLKLPCAMTGANSSCVH